MDQVGKYTVITGTGINDQNVMVQIDAQGSELKPLIDLFMTFTIIAFDAEQASISVIVTDEAKSVSSALSLTVSVVDQLNPTTAPGGSGGGSGTNGTLTQSSGGGGILGIFNLNGSNMMVVGALGGKVFFI